MVSQPERYHKVLNDIMINELAGVVRYTHYSLMVRGPNRIPIVDLFMAQAAESLVHAQQAGEILTGLGGHPSVRIANIGASSLSNAHVWRLNFVVLAL